MKKTLKKTAVFLALTAGLSVIAFPFYLCIVSSFKTQPDLSRNFFGLPAEFTLENYRTVLGKGGFWPALANTAEITVICLLVFSLLLPMMSYAVARRMADSKAYAFLYYFMLAGIFVPFQVRMIPVIKLMNTLGLANKYGLMLQYLSAATGEGLFLISGYLFSIPTDMEEAACIDGANTRQIFFRIMYAILRPVTATVLIKNALMLWNDFMLPNMILRSKEERTLTLFQYTFQGEYAVNYPLVFSAFVTAMLPIMIFYIFMQKNIIGGMTNGAIKG